MGLETGGIFFPKPYKPSFVLDTHGLSTVFPNMQHALEYNMQGFFERPNDRGGDLSMQQVTGRWAHVLLPVDGCRFYSTHSAAKPALTVFFAYNVQSNFQQLEIFWGKSTLYVRKYGVFDYKTGRC